MGKSSVSVPGLGPEILPSIFLKLLSEDAEDSAGSSGWMFALKLFLACTFCLASPETLRLGEAGGEPMNTDPGPELDTTGTGAGGLLLLVITV